ncbi:MAG: ABC transporter substrate-binding protein [Saccharospirillum sp.]
MQHATGTCSGSGLIRNVLVLAAALGLSGALSAQSVSVEDQYGRTVELDKPAERIVTIPIPAASMAVAVDGNDERLAGMHPLSKTALVDGILGDFFPGTRDIPSDIVGQGFAPNIEALLTVNPDLVFQWGHQGQDIVAPLEALEVPLVLMRYGSEEDAVDWLNLMGALTGNPEKADQLVTWRTDTLADVRAATADIPESDKPRVLYFLRFNSELRVAGAGTYNDFYIDLAGGINPAAEQNGWLTVDPEQVLAWDPDVILLNGFEDDLSPADVFNNSLYSNVSAVREQRVYQLPLGGYRWDPPNQESPLTWKWVAMNLHPDTLDWPLREDIASAYAWIYGQTPTAQQIDGILRLEAHDQSADYERFAADGHGD